MEKANKTLKNSEKAITLISLVVTIIVLLILAGISISMLSGNNGVLQRATDAKIKNEEYQIRERIQLAYHSALTKDITGESGELTMQTLQEELDNEFTDKTATITASADKKEWIVKVDDVEVAITAGREISQVATLPSAKGTKPFFPKIDGTWSQVDGTNLTNGLVITDEVDENENSIGNEYVWIEVPSTYLDKTVNAGPNYESVLGPEDYVNIEEALITYSGFAKDGICYTENKTARMGWKDEWYDSSSHTYDGEKWYDYDGTENTSYRGDTEDLTGCGLTYSEYTSLKQKMLKSIYINGGFWIGRYEAGTTIARGSHTAILGLQALSKANVYPFNYVYCGEAQTLASGINNIDSQYNSSLMFGIQWDLVMKYLENKGVTSDDLKVNSNDWGNCYNSSFVINRGKYSITSPYSSFINYTIATNNYVTAVDNVSTKLNNKSVLLTTGASNVNVKQNIYDLVGNVLEWTLEHSKYVAYEQSASRGCYYGDSGMRSPSSARWGWSKTKSDSKLGFRISIY